MTDSKGVQRYSPMGDGWGTWHRQDDNGTCVPYTDYLLLEERCKKLEEENVKLRALFSESAKQVNDLEGDLTKKLQELWGEREAIERLAIHFEEISQENKKLRAELAKEGK